MIWKTPVRTVDWGVTALVNEGCVDFCAVLTCRDNVQWSDEQENAARRKVQENSEPLPEEKQGVFFSLITATHVKFSSNKQTKNT